MTFRDIKKQSRRDLHDTMRVAATCYVGGAIGSPVSVFVRVHNKHVSAGDLAGTSLGYAEVREDAPKIVFDVLERVPARGDVVSVSETEAYRVDTPDPADGEFQVAAVVPLSAAQAATYWNPL